MVPAWSLVLAFVAGLVVGVVGARLTMRPQRAEQALPAAPSEPVPEPAEEPVREESPAPVEAAEASEPESVTEAEAAPDTEQEEREEPEPASAPASAVDDVVAELERRVKGRRIEGEASAPRRTKPE